MTSRTPYGIRTPHEAHEAHRARIAEALDAVGEGEYGFALATILGAVPLPVAAVWAARRTTAVERIVLALVERIETGGTTALLHRERVGLRLAAAHTAAHTMPSPSNTPGRMRNPLLRTA